MKEECAFNGILPFIYIFFIYTYYHILIKKGSEIMTLKERTKKFLNELGIPMTSFARNIGRSPQAIYGWFADRLKLSDNTLNKIEEFIAKYGF